MSHLPSLLPGAAITTAPNRRDLARVERTVSRDVAVVHGKARVLTERGVANIRALEEVSTDAMHAATAVSQRAVNLASVCPAAEPLVRQILNETGMAMGRVVADLARDLR